MRGDTQGRKAVTVNQQYSLKIPLLKFATDYSKRIAKSVIRGDAQGQKALTVNQQYSLKIRLLKERRITG